MRIVQSPWFLPRAALVILAAFAGCGEAPVASTNEPALEARVHRFLGTLVFPKLEFWPQQFSRANAFGNVLAAPLREDKAFLAFRNLYFRTAAAGIDMGETDRRLAEVFARYNQSYDYRQLMEDLAGLETLMRAAKAPEEAPNAFRYAAMGASESLGAGASPASGGWVYRVAERLRQRHPELRLLNAATGGKTTEHALEVQLPEVLKFQPDLVTYAAGLNDLQYGVPVETAKAHTEQILKTLQEKTHAKVVMTGLSMAGRLPIFFANIPKLRERQRNLTRERIAAFDAAHRQLAGKYGAILVDIGQAVPESMPPEQVDALFSYDGVHPNNQGHARIAEIFWKGIEQALGGTEHSRAGT